MSSHIECEREGGVALVFIRRPERKNALTAAMYTALATLIARLDDDPEVRVLLIAGTDDCFTAGNDLTDFVTHPPTGPDSPVFRFLATLAACRKPVVAAVNGVAVGVGTTLLLHCELIYAAEDARFQMPFVNLGLCPEAASSLLLPRLVGYPRAAEWLLLGEPFDAEQAFEAGLINAVLPREMVLVTALERAQALAERPAAAVRLTKALLKQRDAAAVQAALVEEGRAFVARLGSPEAQEAFAAFAEKRKPDFSRFA